MDQNRFFIDFEEAASSVPSAPPQPLKTAYNVNYVEKQQIKLLRPLKLLNEIDIEVYLDKIKALYFGDKNNLSLFVYNYLSSASYILFGVVDLNKATGYKSHLYVLNFANLEPTISPPITIDSRISNAATHGSKFVVGTTEGLIYFYEVKIDGSIIQAHDCIRLDSNTVSNLALYDLGEIRFLAAAYNAQSRARRICFYNLLTKKTTLVDDVRENRQNLCLSFKDAVISKFFTSNHLYGAFLSFSKIENGFNHGTAKVWVYGISGPVFFDIDLRYSNNLVIKHLVVLPNNRIGLVVCAKGEGIDAAKFWIYCIYTKNIIQKIDLKINMCSIREVKYYSQKLIIVTSKIPNNMFNMLVIYDALIYDLGSCSYVAAFKSDSSDIKTSFDRVEILPSGAIYALTENGKIQIFERCNDY